MDCNICNWDIGGYIISPVTNQLDNSMAHLSTEMEDIGALFTMTWKIFRK